MLRSLVVRWLTHDYRTGLGSVMDGSQAARGSWRGDGARAEGAIVQRVLAAVDAGALAPVRRRLEEGGRKIPENMLQLVTCTNNGSLKKLR